MVNLECVANPVTSGCQNLYADAICAADKYAIN